MEGIGRDLILKYYSCICMTVLRITAKKDKVAIFDVSAQIRSAHPPNTRQKLHLEPTCSVSYEISLSLSDADEKIHVSGDITACQRLS